MEQRVGARLRSPPTHGNDAHEGPRHFLQAKRTLVYCLAGGLLRLNKDPRGRSPASAIQCDPERAARRLSFALWRVAASHARAVPCLPSSSLDRRAGQTVEFVLLNAFSLIPALSECDAA